MLPEASSPLPNLHVEANPEMLGVRPDGTVSELILKCLEQLADSATSPEKVALVITDDFTSAVRSRMPISLGKSFTEERGGGIVGGKTMQVGDEIHVVVHAWMFLDADAAERIGLDAESVASLRVHEEARARLALRTVTHEAQHVAMDQAGEGSCEYPSPSWRRQYFLVIADQIISEYRAECGVLLDLRDDGDELPPSDSLAALVNLLVAAERDFRSHGDARKLASECATHCQVAWKRLAYLAAARRVRAIDAEIEVPSPGEESLWATMVGPFWARFESFLSAVPPAYSRVENGALISNITDLADLFEQWMASFSIDWTDDFFFVDTDELAARTSTLG